MSAATVEQEQELSVREAAVVELERFRDRAATAEAKRDADALVADQLEESAGAELLDDDDPDAGDRLAARLATLRASVAMQARVAVEARARAAAAAARALRAESDELAPELETARRALADFDGKTDRLVAAVEKHTGGTVRVLMPDEEAMEAIREGRAQRVEYTTPPRWALADAVESVELRRDVAVALAGVLEGSRSVADLRVEFDGMSQWVAGWHHLPALVREGVVVVEGLWLAAPPDVGPRDWQGEYDRERGALQATRDRLAAAEAGRASQRIEERREALNVDLAAVALTVAHHEARMRSIADQAEALDGVTVA